MLRITHLQAVVVGMRSIGEPVNHAKEWKSGIVRTPRLLAMTTLDFCGRIRIHLVDVSHAEKLGAVIPDITNVQRATVEDLLLQVQAPRSHVRSAQIGVDPENAARTCAAIGSRRREHRPSRT